MKLPRILRGRRTRNGPQGAGFRIRSLDDLHGHFPWPDIGMSSPARREIKNPLALGVRVLRVVEYTVATVAELNMDDRDAGGMAHLGLSGALHALAQHGEWDKVGTLLNALEALICPLDRQRWLDGLDPYKELEEAQGRSA